MTSFESEDGGRKGRDQRRYLERTVRIKKGFFAITEMKMERAGPRAIKAYPSPAATVMAFAEARQRGRREGSSLTYAWIVCACLLRKTI